RPCRTSTPPTSKSCQRKNDDPEGVRPLASTLPPTRETCARGLTPALPPLGRGMNRLALIATRLALLGLVLAAWEALPRAGIVNPLLLPPLSDVLAMLAQILGRSQVQEAVAVTAAEVILAFMIAVPLGAAIGVLAAEHDYFGQVFKPMLFYVFSVPKSIFLPMFILVFGIGFQQKVAYAAFSTMFIVIMSAAAAVESVKADHVLVARSYGATRTQVLARVYVPSMMPFLLETL